MEITYNSHLKKYSRKLRKHGTYAEVLLWSILKKKQIKGYRFNRQKPIGPYIVDFYCSKLKLVIEIDGISHDGNLQKDEIRQNEIEKYRVEFLRFLDEDVKNNLHGVFEKILEWIEKYEKANGIMNDIPANIEW